MGPVRITSRTAPGAPRYANLQPVVDALLRAGNRAVAPFTDNPPYGYLECVLADPIDFDLVQERFVFDDDIAVSRERDSISVIDETGAAICGRRCWLRRSVDSLRFYADRAIAEAEPGRVVLRLREPPTAEEIAELKDGARRAGLIPSDRQPVWHPPAHEPMELLLGGLVSGGNTLEYFDWREPGQRARLGRPIDFDLVQRTFELPDWIECDAAHDLIRDTAHGYVLYGGSHDEPE